jgi:hypothetical protein
VEVAAITIMDLQKRMIMQKRIKNRIKKRRRRPMQPH